MGIIKKMKRKFIVACIMVLLIMPTIGVYASNTEVGQIDSNTQSVYNFMRFSKNLPKFN